jgi:hypothetical protein
MDSKKPEELTIKPKREFTIPKPLASYFGVCMGGFGWGASAGAFVGGAVGFTTIAVTPGLVLYSIAKFGRKLLRK